MWVPNVSRGSRASHGEEIFRIVAHRRAPPRCDGHWLHRPGGRSPAPSTRRSSTLVPSPRGSRFGDVTSARIVREGPARIERGRISSGRARIARVGVDFAEKTWNYASRDRSAPGPAPDPPAPAGSTRPTGDPRGVRAGAVVVTRHRAKDLELRGDLSPDASEAAPARRGAPSAARHGGLRRRRTGGVRRPTRVGLLTHAIRM